MSNVKAVLGIAASACLMVYVDRVILADSLRANGISKRENETSWNVTLASSASKDLERLRAQKKSTNVDVIIEVLKKDPYDVSIKGHQFHKIKKYAQSSTPIYSRRVDDHNRVVYSIDNASKSVHVFRVQGHYERQGR